jgi:selenocysteine lyase/cysteine desulfurase
MIPCQRELFDIPDDAAYFNCSYTSPLLLEAKKAGQQALNAKSNPWSITSEDFFTNIEENRTLFGQIIGSDPDNIAIIPAVSYGLALAAKNLPISNGQNIVVLEEQFPSNIYAWRRMAEEKGAGIKTVLRPENGNWTSAVLEAIDQNTAIAALPHCHWTDGTRLNLIEIGQRCREMGAALAIDGIQSIGALPFSVGTVMPDFLVAAAHKWLLGPYGFGFCYVAPKWHNGRPLEENWLNRSGSQDFSRLVQYRNEYQPGARRYDMGGASSFILAPIAAAAIRQLLEWGVEDISQTLRTITDPIADWAFRMGFKVAGKADRVPHIIGLSMPGALTGSLSPHLADNRVYVSIRGNSIRISPHLYNTPEDVDRLLSTLEKAVKG